MLKARLRSKTDLTDRIAAFELEPAGDAPLPGYAPGAHVEIDLGPAGSRAYSLIDWPDSTPGTYRLAVQREEDGQGGSQAMHALALGSELSLSTPKNDFALQDGTAPVLLLAGGIGVTPLISMATALQADGREFRFHYAGRNRDAMACLDRITNVFGAQVQAHFDDEAPVDLTALMAGAGAHQIYICGPKGMIDAARNAAEAAGIPADQIHVELFTAPETGNGDTSFEVEIASTGQVFSVPADKTIVEALEEGGMDLMVDCQRGDCGICQTDVISGTPDHRDVVLSQSERDSGKVMQICVSRALSDRLVLDL